MDDKSKGMRRSQQGGLQVASGVAAKSKQR